MLHGLPKDIAQKTQKIQLQNPQQSSHAIRPRRSILLIDDDKFSAKFFSKQLHTQSNGNMDIAVKWLSSPKEGIEAISALANDATALLPDLIVIDLKDSSSANLNFLLTASKTIQNTSVRLAVFTFTLKTEAKKALTDAGAVEVFERHSDLEKFGQEMDNLLSISAPGPRVA